MSFLKDFADMNVYNYLAIGGGAVAVLAILLYFIPVTRIKLPAVIVSTVSSLAAGVGIGVLAMASYGYHWETRSQANAAAATEEGRAAPRMMMAGAGGGPQGMKGPGGGPGMAGGGARGPSSKSQLASLVAKLDLLTGKPLRLELTDDQKAKIREQLDGLAERDSLGDDEAKTRLETLEKVLEGEKDILQAVGFRSAGTQAGGGRPPTEAANPFKDETNGQHLKTLNAKLAKG